jgi:hypothetical protein
MLNRTELAQKGYTQRVLGDESKSANQRGVEFDNRGNLWKQPWEKPQPVAPEVYQPDYSPAALPSDAPAWWADSASGGSVGGAQTPPQALPQAPIAPPSPGGAGGTNPMVQLLSAKGGTTNVGESTPLANALRSASLAPQGG